MTKENTETTIDDYMYITHHEMFGLLEMINNVSNEYNLISIFSYCIVDETTGKFIRNALIAVLIKKQTGIVEFPRNNPKFQPKPIGEVLESMGLKYQVKILEKEKKELEEKLNKIQEILGLVK